MAEAGRGCPERGGFTFQASRVIRISTRSFPTQPRRRQGLKLELRQTPATDVMNPGNRLSGSNGPVRVKSVFH